MGDGFTRRRLLATGALGAGALVSHRLAAKPETLLADWEVLADAWTCPDWFRDAKFGIWSHWGPQCVPEQGDWYARQMYIQGLPQYEHHRATYGHPADTGFIDIIGRWKPDRFDPEALAAKYRKAGARYIVSMACHHDNFDNFASRHHPWNAVNVGPRMDIVGRWEEAVRAEGLKFGVSNHSSHAWHWYQTAYAFDVEGPRRGERYDAWDLSRADGKGRFWDGLDPQQLYTGPAAGMVLPEDFAGDLAALQQWHWEHDGRWLEMVPPGDESFAANWLARQNDLVDRYRPDLVYLDDRRLPFGQYGLDAVAHYYGRADEWHGKPGSVVIQAKRLGDYQRAAIMEDVERGYVDEIRTEPWQTCTCIGQWHYSRPLYEDHGYKTAKQVVQRLADVVSKNGNLLLSIPQRGDGSIDPDEEAILADLAGWMAVNGDTIHGSRPWRIFGEGPTTLPAGDMNESEAPAFTPRDIRFTVKGDALCALFLEQPAKTGLIEALAQYPVERVETCAGKPLAFRREAGSLSIDMEKDEHGFVPAVRIYGGGLV